MFVVTFVSLVSSICCYICRTNQHISNHEYPNMFTRAGFRFAAIYVGEVTSVACAADTSFPARIFTKPRTIGRQIKKTRLNN